MEENHKDGSRNRLDEKADHIFKRLHDLRVSDRHYETLFNGMLILLIGGVLFKGGWLVPNRLSIVFLMSFFYGVVVFIKMESLQIQRYDFLRKQEIIDDARNILDSDNLHPVAAKALDAVTAGDHVSSNCSSLTGILERAIKRQATKSIIGFINCSSLSLSIGISIWPTSPVRAGILGFIVFILCASGHILYALCRELMYWAGQNKASTSI